MLFYSLEKQISFIIFQNVQPNEQKFNLKHLVENSHYWGKKKDTLKRDVKNRQNGMGTVVYWIKLLLRVSASHIVMPGLSLITTPPTQVPTYGTGRKWIMAQLPGSL